MLGNFIGTDAGGVDQGAGTSLGVLASGSADHTIGGTTAASENVIKNVSSDAIRVSVPNIDRITIGRNRGLSNGTVANDLFIDLGPDGPGNAGGPNASIAAPPVTAGATPTAISGTALPGALINVYLTPATAGNVPADIIGFAGTATADGSGAWALACPSPSCAAALPGSGQITANQTDANGNSSELSAAVTYAPLQPGPGDGPGDPPGEAQPPADPPADTDPPETSFTKRVKRLLKSSSVRFRYGADESGATFECKLDRRPFKPCGSSRRLRNLRNGRHTFQVRAIDLAGNVYLSMARVRFKVDA